MVALRAFPTKFFLNRASLLQLADSSPAARANAIASVHAALNFRLAIGEFRAPNISWDEKERISRYRWNGKDG